MNGGFGRGKIIEQKTDSSYFPRSNFAQVDDRIEENRYMNNGKRDAFAVGRNSFSRGNSPQYNRSDRGNSMKRFTNYNQDSGFSSAFTDESNVTGRGSRVFARGRVGGFSDDCKYGNNAWDRASEFSSEISAERHGGFCSGYSERDDDFLVDNDRRKSSKSGGRGAGFGANSNLDDGNDFGASDHTGGFYGGRGSGFGGFSCDSSERLSNRKHGFRRGRAFSNSYVDEFRNFDGDRNECSDKFDSRYNEFSSGRGGRSTRGFGSNRNNLKMFDVKGDTDEASFDDQNDFNTDWNRQRRMGFSRSNFSSDWDDRRSNDLRMCGNRDLCDSNNDGRISFGERAFETGVRSVGFSSHIPEDRSIEEMYKEDAENAKYEISDLDQEVTVTGVPPLQKSLRLDDWKNAGFGDLLLRNITEKSLYLKPRNIQAAVIPLVQNGFDMVGHAETGSGKTAAFILPIINYIMNNGEPINSRCAPLALILAPTRELVGQLYNQARKFADGTGVTVAKAYGQYKLMENLMELERGCNLLFATMGRLIDFVERMKVKLHNIRFFVLDEADRMLGQGTFQTDIMSLIHRPDFPSVKNRQTLLFSATFTRDVQELAAQVLKKDHAFVSNGKIVAANPLVEQNFIEVTPENKFDKLIQLLEEDRASNGDVSRTLVFVQRKQAADVIALNLVQKKIRSSSISGDRVQRQREEALADFRRGNINVLVATDVCARGIDIKDLQHVINYDMPNDRVTYVHRIGRTGRLYRGKATSFINVADQDPALIADIVQVVREVQQIPPDFLLDIVNDRVRGGSYVENRRSSGGFGDFVNSEVDGNEGW